MARPDAVALNVTPVGGTRAMVFPLGTRLWATSDTLQKARATSSLAAILGTARITITSPNLDEMGIDDSRRSCLIVMMSPACELMQALDPKVDDVVTRDSHGTDSPLRTVQAVFRDVKSD